jgi:large subunit ribosomal protein L4
MAEKPNPDKRKPEKRKAPKPKQEGDEAPPAKAPRTRRRNISEADTAKFVRAGGRVAPEGAGTLEVVDAENKKLRDVAVHPEVFAAAVNEHLHYEAVKQYRAGARRGTHMTKNRALVSGSGKKPWRQKGTGRARVGEIRNPLWRHGGTVFGPTPRDYSYRIPKKVRLAALRSALSQRVRQGALKVVERFPVEEPKTKVLKGILDQLGAGGKTLLVDHRPSEALVLSGRNIPGLKIVDPSQVNVYDVLDCRTLLVSSEALNRLEERLTP